MKLHITVADDGGPPGTAAVTTPATGPGGADGAADAGAAPGATAGGRPRAPRVRAPTAARPPAG
ncbi:hypothetical protein ACQEVX_03075 [Streptomyces syringium]|uniref:hypothetical protein n=1 Tax=Streptomyces syringium TaxID=76729 RepID=UPI003D8F74EE